MKCPTVYNIDSTFRNDVPLKWLHFSIISSKNINVFRLTIKAKCPMELRTFPMDRQSCPLILGSCEYPHKKLLSCFSSDTFRRLHVQGTGLPMAERSQRELRARHDSVTVRPHELPVQELHFHAERRYFTFQLASVVRINNNILEMF